MSNHIGPCRAVQQAQVDKVGKTLGVKLPACSTIRKTEDGGVTAVQTAFNGNIKIVEVNGKGTMFFSSYCSDEGQLLGCKEVDHVQYGTVSPAKLAAARKLILDPQKK